MKLSKEAVGDLLDRIGIRGIADTLPPLPENVYDLSRDNPALKENIITIYPKTLEDVRLLVGTSVSDGVRYKEHMNLPEHIQDTCQLDFSVSAEVPYMDLYNIANRILHFPCNETEELIGSNEVYQDAVKKIMEVAQAVPVLMAENLVVNDGEVYTISVPTAIFNTITIYGSGSIGFNVAQTKLVANTFNYYPNSKGGNL